jgi:uncharacterized UPF0160 family protein
MKVATHDGTFHADEVFAIAALSLLGEPLEIVRTRDGDAMAACDVRVDVGFASDPSSGDFDHHQKGGAGERPNGVRLASFGLVWREHGPALCGGDAEAAARVDASLVQGIDANDTGQSLTSPLVDGVAPMTVSGVIARLNPTWEDELGAGDEDRRFAQAVEIARPIIEREIAAAGAQRRAGRLVAEAVRRAADPRVIELEGNVPWHETVVAGAPDAAFVILPKRAGWGVEAVPRRLGAFDNRRDLPEAWAGLSGPALAEVTGVPDAVFCHAARFLAVARSREGAHALAALALAEPAMEAETATASG